MWLALLTRIWKAGGVLFVVRGFTVAMNFLAMLGIAFFMGIEEYGRFVFLWASAHVWGAVISLGMPVYLLREFALRDSEGGNAATPVRVLALVVAAPAFLCVALWSVLGVVARAPLGLEGVLQLDVLPLALLIGYLFNLNTNLASGFHGLGLGGFSMLQRDALPQVLALAAAGLAAGDYETTILTFAGAMAVGALLGGALLWRMQRGRPIFGRGRGNSGHFRLPFAFWGSAILGVIWAQVDILVGQLLMTPAELGVYNILRRVANLAALPVTISTWATVGDFSRAFASGNRGQMVETNRRGLLLSIVPGAFLIAASLPMYPFLVWMYGLSDAVSSFEAYLLLLLQTGVLVFFATATTICLTSGSERLAVVGRFLGIGCYVIIVLPFSAAMSQPMIANAAAVAAGAAIAHVYIWMNVKRRLLVDASAISLMRRRQRID